MSECPSFDCECPPCRNRKYHREYTRKYRQGILSPHVKKPPAKPPRHKKEWTEEELIQLDLLAGRPYIDIGKALGRTPRAVIDKLAESKNHRGEMMSLQEAATTYCPHMTLDGGRTRVEKLIKAGKVRAWVTSSQYGHWRINPDDLEKHRDELAAPRKTWKCDEQRRAG